MIALVTVSMLAAAGQAGGHLSKVPGILAPAPPESDQIILRADDRQRGVNLRTRVDTFICPHARIVVTTMFQWVTGRGGWRLRVAGIMINERAASATALAELNRVLASFERPPEIDPFCEGGGLRLAVTQVEQSRPPRQEVVTISTGR